MQRKGRERVDGTVIFGLQSFFCGIHLCYVPLLSCFAFFGLFLPVISLSILHSLAYLLAFIFGRGGFALETGECFCARGLREFMLCTRFCFETLPWTMISKYVFLVAGLYRFYLTHCVYSCLYRPPSFSRGVSGDQ